MTDHRIVIAGAGYGGLSCALRLARRAPAGTSITLVSATDRFIERIRLHQRATGQNIGDWSLPALIRGTGIQLRVGQIDRLDHSHRTLSVGDERIEFDTLVLALGSHVDVDSVKGVREHARVAEFGSVSGIHEALRKIAARSGRVTIVGGGLTGIELATEIAESFPDLQVSLVTQTRLAETWSAAARVHALEAMKRLGVRVEEGPHIRAVHEKQLETDRGNLPFDLCIWAGGFVGHPLAWNSGLKVNRAGPGPGGFAAALGLASGRARYRRSRHCRAGIDAADADGLQERDAGRRMGRREHRAASARLARAAAALWCAVFLRQPRPARRTDPDGGARRHDDRPRLDSPPRRVVQGVHLQEHDVGAADGARRDLGDPVGEGSQGGGIAGVFELVRRAARVEFEPSESG